jgi:hypothetical protein
MDTDEPLAVFIVDNPYEAQEFVWISNDPARVEKTLAPRASPYKVDKLVYVVAQTPELAGLFNTLSNEKFKGFSFKRLNLFHPRNCAVPRITLIAAMDE